MTGNIFDIAGIKLPALESVDEMTEPLTAVAKFSNHNGWTWFVIAGDKLSTGGVYCYGYVESPLASEWGFFTLQEILGVGGMLCTSFTPVKLVTE